MWIGIVAAGLAPYASAQQALTWQQVREKFEAGQSDVCSRCASASRIKAQEITAYLRPNPDFSLTADGFQITPNAGVWRPFSGVLETPGVSYLHEREHKRELRRDSAKQPRQSPNRSWPIRSGRCCSTCATPSCRPCRPRRCSALARENLAYYDQVLAVSRERLQAGDIAQVDLDRLELQRVQYESDVQTALVNLRTAKIQLLTLLNDRTPVEQFDVTGTFDFTEQIQALEEFRNVGARHPAGSEGRRASDREGEDRSPAGRGQRLDRSDVQRVVLAQSFLRQSVREQHFGVSVSIPLRIFDRNQGEKPRTQLDIGRNERLRDANEAQVFSDVDSAYATLEQQSDSAAAVQDQVSGAGRERARHDRFRLSARRRVLLDFLHAQKDYRSIQLNYLNLVGSYLTAANQLNLAVGAR